MRTVIGAALAALVFTCGPATAGEIGDATQGAAFVRLDFSGSAASRLNWGVSWNYDAGALARAGIGAERADSIFERADLRASGRAALPIAALQWQGLRLDSATLSGFQFADRLQLNQDEEPPADAQGGSNWGWYVALAVLATAGGLALLLNEAGNETEDLSDGNDFPDDAECQVEQPLPIGSGCVVQF